MFAEGLMSLLEYDYDVIGLVKDGRALIEEARSKRPDVIVADITMPNLNGLDALGQLTKDNPGVKVVFLTMHQDVAYARRALMNGAAGYVLKHSAPTELVAAIEAARAGETFVTPTLAAELLREPGDAANPVASLTQRQREVLQLFAEGRSAKEVASNLGISVRTAEFHKYQLMETLGLRNSTELTHVAIKYGIVTI